MENNPYNNNYHAYLESLRSNLDNADSYVNSGHNTGVEVLENVKTKPSLLKLSLISFGAIVIGISVISFLTQGLLFVFDKDKNPAPIVVQTDQQKVEDELKKIYVRADLNKDIFASSDEATTTMEIKEVFDITKYFNVNIPGVSRIGYDESFGNDFLTDNINKYSASTLVIGQRDILDENIPGGAGYDETLEDRYDIVDKAVLPVLSSRAYLMADLGTGEIILEKNPDTVYPIASISKLMTAVIATQKMNLQDIAIVSRDATNTYGAQGGLKLGEKIILSDLIYPLLMESSNDAAEVFADHYGRQAFMDEMNKKAKSIGMENTYYNDPSGLDPKNSSNPKDLLKLVRYIWQNDPSIFAATRVKQFSIKGHTWTNRNAQLPLAGYVGGKNGFIDQALQTTASIFEIPTLKGGTRKVVIVILKSNDKNGDVIKLINFLKKSVVYTP
jgi:hypothetical protein